MNHAQTVLAATAVAVMSLGGCSSGGPASGGTGTPTGTAPSATARKLTPFDPPLVFDRARGLPLSSATTPDDAHPVIVEGWNHGHAADRVRLTDTAIYTATAGGLTAVSPATGQALWSATPRTPGMDRSDVSRPLIATVAGRRVVLGAFAVTIPGHGTTPKQPAVELIAADATTGQVTLNDVHPFPDLGDDTTTWDSEITPAVVGATDTAVTISLRGDYGAAATMVADPAAHRIRWFRRDLNTRLVTGDTVVVTDAGAAADSAEQTVAMTAADQTTRWKTGGFATALVGPGLIAIADSVEVEGSSVNAVRIVDAATGKPAPGWPKIIKYASDCVHDGRTIMVCYDGTDIADDPAVSAYESATGKHLWSLPAGGRIAPRVTAVWHGAVYGVTDNGPIVLDARTGQDRQTAPGVVALDVGPYGALAVDERDNPTFYPATG